MFHRLRVSFWFLLAALPLAAWFAPLPAVQAAPSTAYAIAWVNTYKFLAPPPVCTGSGIASQYFGGEECGFGTFTISPADPNNGIL